ncbi:MAG: MBL fold metallo-hydrolase [Pseudomonadota bacterium]
MSNPRFVSKAAAVLGALSLLFSIPIANASSGVTNTQSSQSQGPISTCLAVARSIEQPGLSVRYAGPVGPVSDQTYQVSFSYQGHSTYLIESPGGVSIATDFAGWLTDPITPTAVTMNRAHSSHYTDFPDPKIQHVFRGWGENGDIARHNKMVGDVLIRNVTTDILRFASIPDGNSIFIFEAAGLCIGHLGHLHHRLSEDHYAKIGRLDVVMVPVDGGLTITHASVGELLQRLRSSVILPMHVRFAGALPQFLARLGDDVPIIQWPDKRLTLSVRNLPEVPTVYLMPGVSNYPIYDE